MCVFGEGGGKCVCSEGGGKCVCSELNLHVNAALSLFCAVIGACGSVAALGLLPLLLAPPPGSGRPRGALRGKRDADLGHCPDDALVAKDRLVSRQDLLCAMAALAISLASALAGATSSFGDTRR